MKMPERIGRLNHLQMLTNFVVREHESDLKELNYLNHLHGRLCISELHNLINPAHAVESNLKDKKYLEEIHMIFDGSVLESNVSVLNALQPNNNLKRLTIKNYNGDMFPNWLTGCDLPNLISLKLKNCNGIKIFGNNSTNAPFKFLEVLEFDCMSEWEEWLCMERFPRFKVLLIKNCPKLKMALPQHLPSLQKLVISNCKMLDISIPNCDNIIQLELQNCGRILINKLSPSLKRFENVESFPEENLLPPTLKFLNLYYCSKLRSMNYKGFLPLESLFQISIINCPSLERLPEEGLPNSLDTLDIDSCPLVKEKYKKKGGERWHTISRIPNVEIDCIRQQ